MVLREEDFAAIQINWEDKATNMSAIAHQLDLGLNSFIFVDDSPQERDLIRHAFPEILVPEFPAALRTYPISWTASTISTTVPSLKPTVAALRCTEAKVCVLD